MPATRRTEPRQPTPAEPLEPTLTPASSDPTPETAAHTPGKVQVIRRNGTVTHFDPSKIMVAMTKAFLAVEGGSAATSSRIHDRVAELTEQVVAALTRRLPGGGTVHIEDIQDQVELALMRAGEHKVARDYVLYREARARERAEKAAATTEVQEPHAISVTLADGSTRPLDVARMTRLVEEACRDLDAVDAQAILTDTLRNLFDGVREADVRQALVMSARTLIEREPDYSQVAARLLLDILRREALGFLDMAAGVETQADLAERYADYFCAYINRAADLEHLDRQLSRYDLTQLGAALKPERDLQFNYLGLQTLYDRYFIHTANGIRFELPQAFFMRVAMGLAINEIDREERAIEFYELLSSFDFMCSTPTLFNSGTLRPQLSSCFLTSVPDDLDGIYSAIKDNALLSKFAGGLGNDWTRVRGMGAHIKGTNGKSQGVVPFLKVANDTAVAVNQCFAPETSVFTADGPRPIKDVKVGDLVLGQRGRYREVTEHFVYDQKDAPMVQVAVKHAINDLKVTAGHPFWAIQDAPMEQSIERTLNQIEHGRLAPQWVDAGQLQRGDYVAQVIPSEVVPVAGLTEDDARLYGILLGDGHLTKGREFGVSGNPSADASHLQFVRDYLTERGIHFWENQRGETYLQIKWSVGLGLARCATTGQYVGLDQAHLPFTAEDLYDADGNKRIARRFSHLPHNQTLALVRGLLETDGGISRGKEIYFTSTSAPLAEGLRYQLLRLGIPCAGQYRERDNTHQGTRSDGSVVSFTGTTRAFDLRIPAAPQIADLMGVPALTKHNWFRLGRWIFTRVKAVTQIEPVAQVHDLKVEGDATYMTAAALTHNGGKRKGAVCAYLETWHIDIEEFLDLRKNTGDDRRRTHDMNTANWVPDLFMKRVAEDQHWTLFSPNETPDLHDLTGQAFEQAYVGYEARAERGELRVSKRVKAVDLWRKMLAMLFETGHPWITFKDPMNLRSPQQHIGVVHSSNLCTEIALNTSDDEIAVCFPAGTLVLTRQGQVPIEECDGLDIFVPFDSQLQRQTRYLPARLLTQGIKQVYELRTRNGLVVEATEDHPFLVQDLVDRDKPRTYRWKKLKELKSGDLVACPTTEAICLELAEQDRDYTAAGWMLGDGWMSSSYGVCFGPHEQYAQQFVLPILEQWHQASELMPAAPHSNPPTPYTQPNGVVNWHSQRQNFILALKERFGFMQATGSSKRIGEPVKVASPSQIASFLSGLFSADGSVFADKRITKGGVTISLSSASIELLQDVQLLLKPFGIHGRIRGCQVVGREGRWQGQCEIKGAESIFNFAKFIGFSLSPEKSRKLAESLKRLSAKSAFQHSAVVSIVAKDAKPVYDLALPEDHNFLANGLVVHNCNLGSVNLSSHIGGNGLDVHKLRRTVRTAMRMLDNVIDYNFYNVPQARKSNLRHRPVGLGIMGFQDALYRLRIPYASLEAVQFADQSMEYLSYYAIQASSDLAAERGRYQSFEGSLWSQGILPIDSIKRLEEGRGGYLQMDTSHTLDWDRLRERVRSVGMRNSNCMAIAPTATISNIVGVSQSIEPTYQNLYVKSNLSGEFTVVNPSLVADLKERGLWDAVMVNDLKYFDGSVQQIDRIPDELKQLYATAFEVDARWLVEAGSRRQKWLDQAQSLNLYLKEPNGKKLDNLYKLAWVRGLKTTYYLRSMGATHVEKSTMADASKANRLSAVGGNYVSMDGGKVSGKGNGATAPKACSILDPECEACQ